MPSGAVLFTAQGSVLKQSYTCLYASGHRFVVPKAGLDLAYVGASHHKHTQTGLSDTAADGKGKLACQKHLMEGKISSVLTARESELAVKGFGVDSNSH